MDKVDKKFCDFFKRIGGAVLGTKKAGKRPVNYKPLDSPNLRRMYLQQELMPTIETEREIAVELGRLRKERFEDFTRKLNKKPARDVLKIVAQINSNRKACQFALQDNPTALKELQPNPILVVVVVVRQLLPMISLVSINVWTA